MKRGLLTLAVGSGFAAAAALFVLGRPSTGTAPNPPPPPPRPAAVVAFAEDFDGPLDPARWTEVADGDFKEKTVDVKGGRLRLRCGTIGTDDRTVKFLGVRSVAAFPLKAGTRIAADLDWNDQANGSYLSAALIVAPQETSGNPLLLKDWLKIEYVGVPPGKNGRLVVARRVNGRDLMPYTEGWPQARREGRPIKLQKVELAVLDGRLEVRENGRKAHEIAEALPFDTAWIYLQMSSHSNYPSRELFWDDVRVAAVPPE